MTDKKTFGSFIKEKRVEKTYSQKDLAERLFVTEGAVSKWERGVSYPDITLIGDICRVLDISEHELITASTDTEARKLKHEARNFRVIRSTWFWAPTIAYTVALVTCFICNLAVNHRLSWFFIVLAALLCAYTFVPTVTGFFKVKRLPVFCLSTYLSVCLLLFTCAVYTDGLHWFLTAAIGVLMGYVLLFGPILLASSRCSRYRFVLPLTAACALTVVLLLQIHTWTPFRLLPAILITGYGFVPAVLCAGICALRFDGFLKAGICVALGAVAYTFTDYMVDALFGTSGSTYQVNFNDWQGCLEGNVYFISLLSLLFVSVVFATVGICRIRKRRQ